MMVRSAQPTSAHQVWQRRWGFRVASVMLGLSVFGIAELICVVCHWGRPTDYDDPFVGFSEIHPLFVLDETGENYEIPKSRLGFFAPESFPVRKLPRTFRIFCLGGSTVQGRPYSKETAFTTWLELSLTAADASRHWEVINCGGISYASYRLVPILEECLTHGPDLIVICTGHNEFLEERTYDHIKHASGVWAATQQTLSRFRFFVLFRTALLQATGQRTHPPAVNIPEMKPEVDPLLDYKNGLKVYHRDETWKAGVILHYEHNLRRMIALARNAAVPVVLIRPPSNLSDCPPFKSQHRDDLTAAELRNWKSLIERAKSHFRDDLDRSIERLNQAIEIDGRYAATYYELGKCYEARGLPDVARRAYWRAREEDICPLRMLEPMERALARIAAETNTPLVDAHRLLESKSPAGILGGFLLVDHIHPTFRGHRLIADAVADEMVRQGWVQPGGDWASQRGAAYTKHLESLDTLYYLRGQRSLEGLRAWTQGRADGPPIESRVGAVR